MWPDNETDLDLLGFQVHSDLIRSVVTDQSLLPVTVGVFGDWGSGKSSVMKMLQRDLRDQERIACIYFNGWQFEGYDDAKSALIRSILLELGEHTKVHVKAKKKVASLLKRIDWLRLFNVGYQTFIAPLVASQLAAMTGSVVSAPVLTVPPAQGSSISSESIPDEESLEKIDFTELLKENPANLGMIGARQFRKDFQAVIGETDLACLVILIDDLDRCEPTRLVETLEAIKLFLAVPHVAFVIGADERIMRYAIAKRYETGSVEAEERRADQHGTLVTDYLEKLVQIPYHLPRLSPSEIETYMSLLLCQRHLGDDFATVHRAFLQTRQENVTGTYRHQQIKQALQQQKKVCPDALEAELAWCSSIALSLSDILKGNPRQTKRLLNALLLRRKLAEVANLDLVPQVLVKLMLLEYMQPDLFGQLYRWQAAQHGIPREIQALEYGTDGEDQDLANLAKSSLEKEPRWKEPDLATWVQMPPPLAGQDLRDYFWVTRDRVSGILAGVSTIPLHLRRIAAHLLESEDGIILPEIQSQIRGLATDEQRVLLRELSNLLQRDPTQTHLLNAWLTLMNMIPGAYFELLNTLEQLPASSLDGSLPMKLGHIMQVQPDVQERTVKLLRKWVQDPQTRVGRAAREALHDFEKGGK